jgi:23S rRNA pseudouridine1911/1915/1917 synthase
VTITVEVDDRADKALARAFPDAGRKQLAELFEHGEVRINGVRAKKGDRVRVGDTLELAREPVSGQALRPVPDPAVPLVIILERPDLIAIAKPAGVPSQPLRAGELGTMANAIATAYPECVAISDDPRDGGLVNRLDIGTSGVLVAARTPETYRALREAFGHGQVIKRYVAITCGQPSARACDAPLAQRGKRVVIDASDGLSAYTEVAIDRASADHALVRCTSQTGRMHQIRAHLAELGAPIAGDVLYGGAALPGFEGFFLHAGSATLPLGDETIVAEVAPPERFRAALAACALA